MPGVHELIQSTTSRCSEFQSYHDVQCEHVHPCVKWDVQHIIESGRLRVAAVSRPSASFATVVEMRE